MKNVQPADRNTFDPLVIRRLTRILEALLTACTVSVVDARITSTRDNSLHLLLKHRTLPIHLDVELTFPTTGGPLQTQLDHLLAQLQTRGNLNNNGS